MKIFGLLVTLLLLMCSKDSYAYNVVDTILFEFRHNKIFIPIYLNGEKQNFLFDTGFSKTTLKNYGSSTKEKSEYALDANGSKVTLESGKIDSIRLGHITRKNLGVWFHDFNSSLIKCLNIDGIIGGDFMKGLVIKIDLKKRWLIISASDKPFRNEMKNRNSVSMRFFHEMPYLKLNIARGYNEYVLFDTGDPAFYTLSLNIFYKYKNELWSFVTDSTSGIGGIGVSGYPRDTISYALSFSQKRIGNAIFQNILATTTTHKTSRIGASILGYGSVLIDYKNNRFYITPHHERTEALMPKEELLPNLKFVDNRAVFSRLWPTSEAYKVGIRKGYILQKINGIEILSEEDLCSFKTEISKKSVKIECVDEDGKENVYTIIRHP